MSNAQHPRPCPVHPDAMLQPHEDSPGLQPWCPKGHYLGAPIVRSVDTTHDEIVRLIGETGDAGDIVSAELSEG